MTVATVPVVLSATTVLPLPVRAEQLPRYTSLVLPGPLVAMPIIQLAGH